MQKNDKDGKKTKLGTYNSDNNFINTNNIHEPKKYSRRDFLKLLGMGTAVLTIGGLLNNAKVFAQNPFSSLVTPASNNGTSVEATALSVDDFLLTTEKSNTIRASGSSNNPGSNYYEVTVKPQSGQLNWAGRTLSYTPNLGFSGTDFFKYKAVNGEVSSNEGKVDVNVRISPPIAPYKYKIVQRPNQKTLYTAYDSRAFFSDDTGEKRFQGIVESYDTSFINQEVTAVLKMNGVSGTDRIELVTRTGYPSNQYIDQRSGYVFYLTNSGNQSKRFMILNKNAYEDRSSLVTPKFTLGGSLANRTLGMKAVTYVIPGTNNVKLEFYLDLDNIGDFRLYYELIDQGQIPNASFVNPAGSTAKIRCDKITNSPSLNYFEIAEIDPQSPVS